MLLSLDGASANHGPDPQILTVDCQPETLPVLAKRLTETGTGGYRVVVRVSEWQARALTPEVVAGLAAVEVSLLEIAGPLDGFADESIGGSAWLEFGKAVLRHGLPFGWQGRLPRRTQKFSAHLTPARDDPEGAARWRYALLYWRRGPGFLTVTDARREAHDRLGVRQLTIDLEPLTAIFGNELDRSAPSGGSDRSVIAELQAAGLVGLIDDIAVFLPYRARYWPLNRIT